MQLKTPLPHLEMRGEIQGTAQRLEEPAHTTNRPNKFHRICLIWFAGWGLATLLTALPAYANDPAGELSRIERSLAQEEAKKTKALQRQRKTQKEISQIKARLTKLARDLKQNQLSLTKARKAYEAAQERLKKTQQEIQSGEQNTQALTFALVKLSLTASPIAYFDSDRANQSIRSAAVLATIKQDLQHQTRILSARYDSLIRHTETAQKASKEHSKAKQKLAHNRSKLDTLLKRKTDLKRSIDKDFAKTEARIKALARKAANLKELLASLTKEPPASRSTALPGRGLNPTRKGLLLPAEGSLVATFSGDHKGIKIASLKGGRIIAPWAGKVLFADEFRQYGNMVIIAHSGGFYSVLGSLARIDVGVGSQVIKGEPLGIVGSKPLYFEWRKNGEVINPLPWLASSPQVSPPQVSSPQISYKGSPRG